MNYLLTHYFYSPVNYMQCSSWISLFQGLNFRPLQAFELFMLHEHGDAFIIKLMRVTAISDNIDFSRLYPNDFFYSAVWLLKLQPMKTKFW